MVVRTRIAALTPFLQSLPFWLLKGSFKRDMGIDIHTDVGVEVDVDKDRYFGCLTGGASMTVQVLLNGKEAVTVLTLMILKWRAAIYLKRTMV